LLLGPGGLKGMKGTDEGVPKQAAIFLCLDFGLCGPSVTVEGVPKARDACGVDGVPKQNGCCFLLGI
jgi:hypothetical protein